MKTGLYNILQDFSHAILGAYNLPFTASQSGLCWNLYPSFAAWPALQSFFLLFLRSWYSLPKIKYRVLKLRMGRKEGHLSDKACRESVVAAKCLSAAAAKLLQCFCSPLFLAGATFQQSLLKAAFPATQSSWPKQKSKQEQTQCGLWQRSPSLHI